MEIQTLVLLVGNAILAVLVGERFRKRGGHFWVGFLLSFLLSPILGFLISTFVESPENKLIRKKIKKRCSGCKNLVEYAAEKCDSCGRQFGKAIQLAKKDRGVYKTDDGREIPFEVSRVTSDYVEIRKVDGASLKASGDTLRKWLPGFFDRIVVMNK